MEQMYRLQRGLPCYDKWGKEEMRGFIAARYILIMTLATCFAADIGNRKIPHGERIPPGAYRIRLARFLEQADECRSDKTRLCLECTF